jgi:hypothetical protein
LQSWQLPIHRRKKQGTIALVVNIIDLCTTFHNQPFHPCEIT